MKSYEAVKLLNDRVFQDRLSILFGDESYSIREFLRRFRLKLDNDITDEVLLPLVEQYISDQGSVALLQERLTEEIASNEKLEAEIADMRTLLDNQDITIKSLQDQGAATQKAADQTADENKLLLMQKGGLEAQIKQYEDHIADLRTQNEDLHNQIAELQNQIAELKTAKKGGIFRWR